jgi:hypothetical protein
LFTGLATIPSGCQRSIHAAAVRWPMAPPRSSTSAGAVYTLVLYRRGELADPIVAHATTNAMLAACVLATGRWSLWT